MNGHDGSFIRAIRGPITLITLGVLFALNNFTPYGFDKTWPVLLIVFGLLSLMRRGLEPPPPPPPPPPPYTYAAPGGYAQSSYQNPPPPAAPSTAAKGGFGSSAPARSSDPQGPPSGDPAPGDSV
jgi:hypothetical protein